MSPRTVLMIQLTRLNGQDFALNGDLIERVDRTPDTVITLLDGTKYVVAESLEEVVDRMRDFRASVLVRSLHMEDARPARAAAGRLRVVTDPEG
jgi:flagellar protein FlbD